MRTFFNVGIALAFGIVGLFGSVLIAFALLSVLSHDSASGSGAQGVGALVVAVLLWPLHVFVALLATAATFLWRQSRDARKADEALAEALRDAR